MQAKTIHIKPGTTEPTIFLRMTAEELQKQEDDTLRLLISSIAVLVLLYILKYFVFMSFAVIRTVENGIAYWRFDVPTWIQTLFTIMTVFSVIKVAYFYRKYKQQK